MPAVQSLPSVRTVQQCKTPHQERAVEEALRFIRLKPGASMNELRGAVPNYRRLRWVLDLLSGDGLVVEGQVLGARRYYPPGFEDDLAQLQAAVLRDGDTLRLYRCVVGATLRQKELMNEAASWGWSPGRTRRCIARLRQARLLQRTDGTHQYRYWRALKPHPRIPPIMR